MFLTLLGNLTASGETDEEQKERNQAWLLLWIADIVYQPGIKPGVGVVIKALPASGKDTLIDLLHLVLRGMTSRVTQARQMIERFSDVQVNTLLVYKSEADDMLDVQNNARGNVPFQIVGQLKDKVEAEKMPYEQKHHNPTEAQIYERYLFMMNNTAVLPTKTSHRKITVFEGGEEYISSGDRTWFEEFRGYMADEKIIAGLRVILYHYRWLHRDTSLKAEKPDTYVQQEMESAPDYTLHWLLQYLEETKENVDPNTLNAYFEKSYQCKELFDRYVSWLRNYGYEPGMANIGRFANKLRELAKTIKGWRWTKPTNKLMFHVKFDEAIQNLKSHFGLEF